ncbi:MAG: glycosyltransferase family 4 protein, partial [Actinobacteria bacterium]|nr:glycosyltransferase family 4 protein [Actinomycetota bacterium]
MRIAQIAPAWLTVPPEGYGGIESMVSRLADGLVTRGHDVTLFASGGSATEADLVSHYDEAPGMAEAVDKPYL